MTVPWRRRLLLEQKSWTSWWKDADAVGGQEGVEDVQEDVVDVLSDLWPSRDRVDAMRTVYMRMKVREKLH